MRLRAMTALVMIDGCVMAPERARVSVFDRGFLYGDAVFETIRTYGGRTFALDEHMDRLARSAGRVLIPLPVPIATIRAEVLSAVAEAGNPESYVRAMLTRGSGPLDLAPGPDLVPLRVVIVGPLRPPPPEAYAEGVGVITHRTQRTADATDAAGAKVTNYLVSVLAMRQARAVSAAEALIVDRSGCVVEGATSNVFAVIDGRLVTPPEAAGILLGITRQRVIEAARDLGLEVVERALPLADLAVCSELFISSSIREMLPVVRVDGAMVGSGKPGAVTLGLLAAFRAKVGQDMGLDPT
jgi:branched-chain amino acid aminotransferase